MKMKKTALLAVLILSSISFNAQAFWGGNNNFFGNNGWGNSWPVWTPMYWMEEFTGDNDYYGNANPWGGAPMNNMPYNTNPWSNGSNNGANFPPNGYSPYSGGSNMGYPQAYRPLRGFQNMPLAPSRGPISFRP